MVVKSKRQGNSTILPIPKYIKVPVNTEFEVYQDDDGNIVYTPVSKRPHDLWTNSQFDDFDYDLIRHEELQDLGYNPREVSPIGKEKMIFDADFNNSTLN
ncbi:hypothetical protein [Levilactobacillus koreensis]|uniref:AbrB family transcriptional regulator n=1 Tax=Levilactobacillus koreensis TaxID=637971 RepID=A0AAC9ER16_9LACO|nr:hypothetical protein [Levilactobacillus koreensis]AKP64606.1 hypothetical protein ABN16_06115 [Levilactobacillus koreensis]